MKEVSCKMLDPFFREIRRRDLPADALAKGTGLSVEHLRNKNERLDWSAYAQFMGNVGAIWSNDELIQIGRRVFESPYLRPFSVIARLLFTATDFYKWVFAQATGGGEQNFAGVQQTLAEQAPGRLLLTLKLPDGFAPCPQFFWVCKGNFSAMPRLLGLPAAQVEMTFISDGATFDVVVPPGGGWLGRLKRALLWPFTVRAAAQELKEAHETLQARYRQLDDAQRTLAVQAYQLQTVNDLGRELTQHTELAEYAEALAKLLRERFKCESLRLTTLEEAGDEVVVRDEGTHGGPQTSLALVTAGQRIGRLELWGLKSQSDQDPDVRLLRDLLPWFSIALDNARSFGKLRESQALLERRVEERTFDLKKTTDQLQVALEQQKEIDRQKTQFFANASHELRTPLTLLLAPMETLANSANLHADAKLELGAALRNGYRLIKLVNDLLDLSKIEAGRLHLRMGPTDLARLVDETLRPWRPALQKRQIRVEAQYAKSIPIVADAERLEQVLLNLVSNAVKHTPDGGYLRLSADRQGEQISFAVENSGEGVDPEDVSRIFERFGQSMHSRGRRFGSTGLGLSVVREIIELHGGTVSLDNHPGESVAFKVVFPNGQADEALQTSVPSPSRMEVNQYEAVATNESIVTAPSNGVSKPSSPNDTAVLLLVEDNADLRAYLARGLAADFEVHQATNGQEGLDYALKHRPNVILSDVMMPIMDGIEMCRRIKADPQGAGIPLVLLTARSDLEAKLSGLEGGADDFVVKPFHLEEVKARLKTQLRLRQLTAKLTQSEKLAALGTLVGGVAHEVRNPLNGIINALKPLREMIPEGERDLLDTAIQAAERVETISAQLLLQARAGEGAYGPVNLADNIAFALKMLAHKAKGGPEIVCQVSDTPPVTVVGESGALNQIWINLIDNAILAAGPKGKVTVTAHGEGKSAIVEVVDDGPGIAANVLPRIFDPFFTTRDVGKGTGLGLAVVREIVDRHGGKVAVQSRPGAGARFLVTLPSIVEGEEHALG